MNPVPKEVLIGIFGLLAIGILIVIISPWVIEQNAIYEQDQEWDKQKVGIKNPIKARNGALPQVFVIDCHCQNQQIIF